MSLLCFQLHRVNHVRDLHKYLLTLHTKGHIHYISSSNKTHSFQVIFKFIFQIRGLKLKCHEGLYEKRRQSRHAKRIAISWWFSSESATDVAECLEYLQSHTKAQHQTNMQLRALVQDSNIQFKKVRDQLSFDE